MELVAVFE